MKSRGYLLIDVVFSIALITILCFSLLPLIYNSMKNNYMIKYKNILIDNAQSTVEEVIAKVYSGEDYELIKKTVPMQGIELVFDEISDDLFKITVYSKEYSDEIKLYAILEKKRDDFN